MFFSFALGKILNILCETSMLFPHERHLCHQLTKMTCVIIFVGNLSDIFWSSFISPFVAGLFFRISITILLSLMSTPRSWAWLASRLRSRLSEFKFHWWKTPQINLGTWYWITYFQLSFWLWKLTNTSMSSWFNWLGWLKLWKVLEAFFLETSHFSFYKNRDGDNLLTL